MIRGLLLSLALHTIIYFLIIVELSLFKKDLEKQEHAFVVDIVSVSDFNNLRVSPKKQETKSNTIVKEEAQERKQDNNKTSNSNKAQSEAETKAIKKTAEKKLNDLKAQVASDVHKQLVDPKNEAQRNKIQKKPEDDAIALAKNPNKEEVKKTEKPEQPQKNLNDTIKSELLKDNKKPEKEGNNDKKLDNKKQIEEKKKQDDEFTNSILKSLKEGSKGEKKVKNEDKNINDLMNDALQGESNTEYNPDLPLSISEISAIRSQIEKAWNASSFSGGDDNITLKVTLRVKLDKEGNVSSVKPIAQSGSGSTYRAFVDSAIRAVHAASPLKHLPEEKYSSWQEIELNFDSSGMIY